MKVFICSKVPRGHPPLEAQARSAVSAVEQAGCTAFLAYAEIARLGLDDPQKFMPFACQAIRQSDLLLALYDLELRGGLIEIGIAYSLGIPVWLAYRAGVPVSSSALGCAALHLVYNDLNDLEVQIVHALKKEIP